MVFTLVEIVNLISGNAFSMKFKLSKTQMWNKLTFGIVHILMSEYLMANVTVERH